MCNINYLVEGSDKLFNALIRIVQNKVNDLINKIK